MTVVTKRSSMTFFSDPTDIMSHRVRMVLHEKGVTVEIVDCDPENVPDEVRELNPYGKLPTLVDRDLSLFEANVMMEYLDERFPHPPLLPVYPVARANSRQMITRIDREWTALARVILKEKTGKRVDTARKALRDSVIATNAIFEEKPYFMSDDFSLVDCAVAPILWRSNLLGLDLPAKSTVAIREYGERVFGRECFQLSMSEVEAEMRD
ncbi:stringent starvation protein A [Litorivicinus lipolyticus]|uniref:Stringent starvation protein A n=1 Tax=Litorivicinus lipolyticus TaxID=418701 RepID=A0A5Q2QGK2_9GAMM|nr:glutathione S-transferase N-terminal domain-containing protein [Litorivicinus lipolyticus]QGG80960.1 stringent starvation protein A [Litorivicinus lipolyticus]